MINSQVLAEARTALDGYMGFVVSEKLLLHQHYEVHSDTSCGAGELALQAFTACPVVVVGLPEWGAFYVKWGAKEGRIVDVRDDIQRASFAQALVFGGIGFFLETYKGVEGGS